jgi:autotransporter-associated beta strand protein
MNVAAVCRPQESSVMRSAGIAWLVLLGCASIAAAAPPAVMPLGDSITYGRGSGVDIAGGYRSPLYSAVFGIGDYVDLVGSATGNPTALLTTAGETQHNGYRSATLAELDGNLNGSVSIANGNTNNEGGYWITGTAAGRAPVFPTAVLLLGGINDVAGSSNVSVPTALARLDALVGDIFALRPDTTVFVSNLTPITGTPATNYGTKVTDFNAGVPAIVATYAGQGRKAYLVDMYSALSNPAADIGADGIHPTQAGYDKMATTWFGALTSQGVVVANARPTFTGTSNALWSGTGSWSGGVVPAAAAEVRFDQARNTNLNVSGTVSSLTFTALATVAGVASGSNSNATLTIMSGLTHTANTAGTTFMRVKNIVLGADQTWDLNGVSGTNSAGSSGFTLTPQGSASSVNNLNLAGFTWIKTGSGQVSLGNIAIGSGSISIDAGSIRFATSTMGASGTSMQVNGAGSVTVKPGAAILFSAASTNGVFDVTKPIRMEGSGTNPSILHYAGTTNSIAPTIAAPIEWAGTTNVVSFWSASTGVSGTVPWTFSGNWTGSGTTTLLTSATAAQSNGRITIFSGSNAGFSGLVDNRQSDGFSEIRFGSANAGSADAEWRLSNSSAIYKLNGNSVSLGALSGTAGTLANGAATNAVATIGGKGSDTSFSGLITNGSTGLLGIVKTGTGTLALAGSNSYTGATTVNQGRLAVNGSIAASSGVSVAAGASLGGSGAVPGISGAGLVGPGNSPGVLTAPTVDVGTGIDFAFEMTGTGSPVYGSPSASINDVLRLTTGISGTTTAANVVGVYFSSLAVGDVTRGGFYIDTATTVGARAAAASLLADATWAYYVFGDGNGTHAYGGSNYYTLVEYDPSLSIEWGVVADPANFGSGPVTGAVTQFTAVPEPGGVWLASTAIGLILVRSWVRRPSS